jgi:hypothetical protein
MLAHVHIEKTAGQTIRAILRKNFGPDHCDLFNDGGDPQREWKWTARCYPRLRSIAGHAVGPTPAFERYFRGARYYTFVREPLRRCISHYQFVLQAGVRCGPFREWVQSNADHQTRMIAGEPDADKAIEMLQTKFGFVGLVERFNESLLLWRRWTGLPQIRIGYRSVNVARCNGVRAKVFSDVSNRALIRELHQQDAKLYRYVVEELYPRQVAAYGEPLDEDVRSFAQALAGGTNLSWAGLLGKAKRNLIYKPVIRLLTSGRKAA